MTMRIIVGKYHSCILKSPRPRPPSSQWPPPLTHTFKMTFLAYEILTVGS
jgi:hypothetical protein